MFISVHNKVKQQNFTMDPYGFTRRIQISKRNPQIPQPVTHFIRKAIRTELKFPKVKNNKSVQAHNRSRLAQLELDYNKIWEREKVPECPKPLLYTYYALCGCIDILYEDNPIDRFWFLETVARMPYFSYVSILHFYETMGWWSIDDKLREEHNREDMIEGNHLLIMESLGGGSRWRDRFLARHTAIAYYTMLLVLYLASPRIAYKSSEMLELHAVATYTEFLDQNKELLEELPIPIVGQKIYGPSVYNLYQVFWLIAGDERKHAASMSKLSS